jgi:sRNA-binding regulator protein Hfq
MSNQRSPQSKPNQQPGIRPPDLLELTQRLEAIEKLVRDNLDEKNQWSSKVREWIDKPIAIQLVDSTVVYGILKWVDRYTVCLQEKEGPSVDVTIVHKGAIAVIRRYPG